MTRSVGIELGRYGNQASNRRGLSGCLEGFPRRPAARLIRDPFIAIGANAIQHQGNGKSKDKKDLVSLNENGVYSEIERLAAGLLKGLQIQVWLNMVDGHPSAAITTQAPSLWHTCTICECEPGVPFFCCIPSCNRLSTRRANNPWRCHDKHYV